MTDIITGQDRRQVTGVGSGDFGPAGVEEIGTRLEVSVWISGVKWYLHTRVGASDK